GAAGPARAPSRRRAPRRRHGSAATAAAKDVAPRGRPHGRRRSERRSRLPREHLTSAARRQACLLSGMSTDVLLVGLGRMGSVHLDAIRTLAPRLRLAAVAEPRAELAAPDRVGDAVVYADTCEALAHPGLRACIVATPTDTHRSVVARALEAGVHVFCEKPLTLAAAESLELEAAARERGLVLQVGFWR